MSPIYPIAALKDNYIWIMVNFEFKQALVVDPGESTPVINFLKQHQLSLCGVLITHHHWDHVRGVKGILSIHPAPVFGSFQNPLDSITNRVNEGDVLTFNSHFPTYRVMAIPGHTLDHIAYYANGTLFCGDTLFAGGCGRLFEGTVEQLYSSLQKIANLPDETHIYCAHEYTLNNLRFAQMVEPNNLYIKQRINEVQTLRQQNKPSLPSRLIDERQTNPFLRCDQPEIITNAQNYVNKPLKQPQEIFAALRAWKDNF